MTTLRTIQQKEIACGIAISPRTPAQVLFPFVGVADMLLVMTVEPGFGGQTLIPETLDKVRALRRYAYRRDIDLMLEVDGGIGEKNASYCTEAGANILVAGSSLFKTKRPRSVMQKMREAELEHPFLG